MPPVELVQSSAPLADMYTRATGEPPLLISIISLLAMLNGALIQIIMGSRALYGMSRRGWRRIPAVEGVRSYPRWVPAAGLISTLGLIAFQLGAWVAGI